MCARCPDLPLLPGLTFNRNLGRTKFNLNPEFEMIGPGIRALKEKVKPRMFGDTISEKYPSLYPRGEVTELPAWIVYNKEMLAFEAFFKETLVELPNASHLIRFVKIYFFLEDGTIMVVEPKKDNSGISQGTLIARHRIRLPAPMDDNFYDVLDLNVGKEVEFYGKIFKITNCDKFTRYFLNRCGIAVPDPIQSPVDPYLDDRYQKEKKVKKKSHKEELAFAKFLKNDKKVLRFTAFWDDRNTPYGYFHHLEVLYYLADDTIEIKEIFDDGTGKPNNFAFLKKSKLPKFYNGLPSPGANSKQALLNVLGAGFLGSRYLVDPLGCGLAHEDYYKDNDLAIGAVINCFGRKIVLSNVTDFFTKEYYKSKYGVDTFTPLEIPKKEEESISTDIRHRTLPPWNGFGSFEDSAQNCRTVDLKPLLKDFRKFLKYDRKGLDSYVLRFKAKMISKIPENETRNFITSYYLADETIQIVETATRNSGFNMTSKVFLERTNVPLPGQDPYKMSQPPIYILPQDMYIGALLNINSFIFRLIDCDEYALRYMELNAHKYPKSNIKVIMEKIREKLRPTYKDFVAENLPTEKAVISYHDLREKLYKLLGEDNFTEHEMLTIARAFPGQTLPTGEWNREQLRALTLTELKRNLWDDLDRLHEYFLHQDVARTGKMSKEDCYTVMRACRLPLDREMIRKILDVIKKDENCCLYYNDILDFLNCKVCSMAAVEPINIKHELDWGVRKTYKYFTLIDWCAFNKCLDLESTFQ